MKYFGSIFDPDFGNVCEAGIMITMEDLLETKKKRYIEPYLEFVKKVIEERKVAKREARKIKLTNKAEKAKLQAQSDSEKKSSGRRKKKDE